MRDDALGAKTSLLRMKLGSEGCLAKEGGGVDQRRHVAFSDMEVTAHLSSQREALQPPTEDRISGNQAQNPWEINNVDSLALRRDSTGF